MVVAIKRLMNNKHFHLPEKKKKGSICPAVASIFNRRHFSSLDKNFVIANQNGL